MRLRSINDFLVSSEFFTRGDRPFVTPGREDIPVFYISGRVVFAAVSRDSDAEAAFAVSVICGDFERPSAQRQRRHGHSHTD